MTANEPLTTAQKLTARSELKTQDEDIVFALPTSLIDDYTFPRAEEKIRHGTRKNPHLLPFSSRSCPSLPPYRPTDRIFYV
jgi:hypothetical protein